MPDRRNVDEDIFGRRRKTAINSKVKGNRNELDASKWLTRWTGIKFTRTPSSGGLRWKNNSSVCGDVVCEDENVKFNYSVETKHLKKVFMAEYLRSNSVVFKIWRQAADDAKRAGKKPFVLVRENGMPKGEYYVIVDEMHGNAFVSGGLCDNTLIYVYDSEWFINNVKYSEL